MILHDSLIAHNKRTLSYQKSIHKRKPKYILQVLLQIDKTGDKILIPYTSTFSNLSFYFCNIAFSVAKHKLKGTSFNEICPNNFISWTIIKGLISLHLKKNLVVYHSKHHWKLKHGMLGSKQK